MATKKTVVFSKWKDPMVSVDRYDEVYPPRDGEDSYETVREQFNDYERPAMSPYKGPYLHGPLGFIPLNETNLPGKVFNFWMGHTNFDITAADQGKVDRVAGVEVLRVFTRYRFWFAVGRQFDDQAVRDDIEKALCGVPAPPKPATRKDPVHSLTCLASSRFAHWAVVRKPNGRLECVGGGTSEEVKGRLAKLGGGCEVKARSWPEEGDECDGGE